MGEKQVDIKWLEGVLKKGGYQGMHRIDSLDVEPAVADGENYVSKIFRLTAHIVSQEGDTTALSIILKRKHVTQLENKDMEEKIDHAFDKEYRVYVDLLSRVGKYTLNKEQVWAKCLASVPGRDIYFQDLKATGHRLADRFVGLDFDHTMVVMKNLANLHAASCVAVDKGEMDTASHTKYIMVGTVRIDKLLRTNEVEIMADVIRKEWQPQWSSLADRLEKYKDDLLETVSKIGNYNESNFNVFNHGDPWVSNFMFKYDTAGKPVSIKFVDFQLYHYNSFGLDLCYFLNTSVSGELKKRHLSTWIDAYCDTFSQCLRYNGSSLSAPTPDMVKKELLRLSPFSLLISLRIRPVVQSSPEDVLTITEMWNDVGVHSKKRKIYQNPAYAEVMKSDLKDLLDAVESVYKHGI